MTQPRRSRQVRPRVYLHIGEPKTATTFVQQVLRTHRAVLQQHGVHLPGASQQAVFRAVQDLRGVARRADDPSPAWAGEWDRLARQALRAPRSVVSHELLCAVDDRHAARAVASLRGADVHVVVTVRDMASLLPAEWQESVKHRSTRAWDDWLGDVIDKESGEFGEFGAATDPVGAGRALTDAGDARREFWFWRVHDTVRILQLWHRHVPRSRIHVITVPPRGADRGEVWRRFAGVLDVPAGAVDPGDVRTNASLGLAEVELLRRLNGALSPSVPGWSYMAEVKEPLAHRALAGRPSAGRLELPLERLAWAGEYAEHLTSHVVAAGYDVVGDLADLRPAAPTGEAAHPAGVTDEQLLDAAVAANAALLRRRYHGLGTTPVHRPEPRALLLHAMRSAPAVRRRLYHLSERNRLVGAARTRLRDGIERRRDDR